jgi:hypothetical protein
VADEAKPEEAVTRMIRSAAEDVVNRTRAFADLLRTTGGTGLTALSVLGAPVPRAFGDVVSSLQGLMDQTPGPGAQLDMFLQEIHAKRALVQALQTQLASFETQLEILEHSLEPLRVWGTQWSNVQSSLADALTLFRPPGGSVGRQAD